MEDKSFELMTKMYNEMQSQFKDVRNDIKGIRTEVKDMQTGMKDMQTEMTDMRTEMTDMRTEMTDMRAEMEEGFDKVYQEMLRMEQKYDSQIDALFDGYKQNTEAITELRKDVQVLSQKVETHEVKLKIVR